MTVGELDTQRSSIDKSCGKKKKLSNETLELNGTINQMDITGIYRTFHSFQEPMELSTKLITYNNTKQDSKT